VCNFDFDRLLTAAAHKPFSGAQSPHRECKCLPPIPSGEI
jgi:hypothetical protein